MNYNVIGPDNAVYGPVDFDTLKRWVAEGRVLPTTMIEEVGSGKQVAASTMPGLFPAPPAPTHQLHAGYDTPVQSPASPVQPGAGPGAGPGFRPIASPTAAYSSVSSNVPIPNNLVKAIFSTICCCIPFGVVAIVYAAQVGGKQASGDYYGAQDSATKANTWANIAIGIGIAWIVVNILLVVLGKSLLPYGPHPVVPPVPGQ